MRPFYYQLLLLTTLLVAGGLSATSFAAESTDSLLPLVAQDPATNEQLVMYNEFSYTAAEKEAAPPAAAAPTATATCCPTAVSCESGCGGCGHWIAGVEATWLSPQQHSPYASFSVIDSGLTVLTYYKGGDVTGLFLSPRIWLGYQGDKWGLQARYWRLCEPKDELIPGSDTSYNGVYYSSVFKTETADVEATRLFYWRNTKNVFSFGIRYAELKESQAVSATQEFNGGATVFNGRAYARHDFSGTGPTVALTGYLPLQNRNFNLFYSLRGSYVWDDQAINQVEARADYADAISSDTSLHGSTVYSKGDMFIGEMQVGAQWNFELVQNRADAFLRFSLEYQYWDTSKTGYNSTYAAVNNADYMGISTVSSGDTRADLIGFSIATGFTW